MYVPGRFYGYFTDVAPEATWPGPVLLGSLEDGGGGLRLAAGTGDGIPLGESEAVAEGVEQVGFRCPPDQRCRMTVAPRPGEWAGNEVPFTLDVRAASLVPAGQFVAPVPIQDVGLYGGRLVVTGVLGLGILDPATLSWVGVAVKPELLVAQATAACGGYLCVARLGLEGLKVVDLSDPASPTVKGSASTAGLGWDLATRGSRVYVAHGVLGVGVYDVSSQGHPTRVRTLWPGGVVRTDAEGITPPSFNQRRNRVATALSKPTCSPLSSRSSSCRARPPGASRPVLPDRRAPGTGGCWVRSGAVHPSRCGAVGPGRSRRRGGRLAGALFPPSRSNGSWSNTPPAELTRPSAGCGAMERRSSPATSGTVWWTIPGSRLRSW
jgi:hypothetical protein